ncbi:MAG: hypothetical protein U9O64_09705 [Campylobacterota bacterium]|nr:hypothetical protein [Campylobacterota bacterium]
MGDREEARRLMELQKDALKDEHGVGNGSSGPRIPANARSANNAKLAKLYEDAAEYEAELKGFETEFKILNDTALDNLVMKLNENAPEYEGDYAQELSTVVVNGWTQLAEDQKRDAQEQLVLLKETVFSDMIEKLNAGFPEHTGDFEAEIREILVKRWEFLIEIKKEHIADERADMKLQGMKPDHIRKVYYNYHGILVD